MSEKNQEKRVRGSNYTAQEKALLADLIMQHKDIVEDKRTTALYVKKKRQAWQIITTKYNSAKCITGPRKTDQLKTLYDNIKQSARRRRVDESNVQVAADYESNKPKASESAAKALDMIQNEVDPLKLFKSGEDYFKDSEVPELDKPCKRLNPNICNTSSDESNDNNVEEIQWKQRLENVDFMDTPSTSTVKSAKNGATHNNAQRNKMNKRKFKKMAPENLTYGISVESLKKLYFKNKGENAHLERKKLMLEISFLKQEHSLKMAILNKRLENK